MTKKDYYILGRVCRIVKKNAEFANNASDDKKIGEVALSLSDLLIRIMAYNLKQDNPRFNRKKFIDFINS